MVFGSDWPHVGLYDPDARPDVGALLDLIADYAPDPADQHRILVENPPRFYGLPPDHRSLPAAAPGRSTA